MTVRVLKVLWLLVVWAALAGCATTWIAPAGFSELQIKRDDYECRRESRVVAYPPTGEATKDAFTRGFHQGLFYRTLREAQDLYALCLEARGYTAE